MNDATSRSLAFQKHSRVTIAVDATGNVPIMFAPGFQYLYSIGTMAAGVATYTAFDAGYGNLANVETYRIVSWGLRVRKVTTPLNSSGIVRVRTFGAKGGTFILVNNVSTYNCDGYADVPLSKADDVTIIGKPLDLTNSLFTYPTATNPTANVTDWIAPGWGAVQVAVEGGPAAGATSVLDIEIIVNYEVVLRDSDTLAQLATYGKTNATVTDAAQIVQSSGRNIFTAGLAVASRYIEGAALQALASLI